MGPERDDQAKYPLRRAVRRGALQEGLVPVCAGAGPEPFRCGRRDGGRREGSDAEVRFICLCPRIRADGSYLVEVRRRASHLREPFTPRRVLYCWTMSCLRSTCTRRSGSWINVSRAISFTVALSSSSYVPPHIFVSRACLTLTYRRTTWPLSPTLPSLSYRSASMAVSCPVELSRRPS